MGNVSEHPGSGRAGASGPHASQDPGWVVASLSRMGSACIKISKAGAPSLSWSRSQSTGCRREQNCTACAILTFPQSSLLNVPQWVCGNLATRIRMQGQRGVFTLSQSSDPQPGAGHSQPLVAEQSTCTSPAPTMAATAQELWSAPWPKPAAGGRAPWVCHPNCCPAPGETLACCPSTAPLNGGSSAAPSCPPHPQTGTRLR